jgi:hypothetical protein
MSPLLFCSIALAQSGPSVQAGGEVRVDLVGMRLDRLHPDVDEAPELAFRQTRGFMRLDADLPPRFSARLQIDVSQSFATTVWPGGQRVATYADTYRLRMMDAYVDADLSGAGRLRMGMQLPMFGNVDTFVGTQSLYMVGNPQFQDAVRQAGLLPNRTLGVRWDRNLGQRFLVSAQVANAVGHTEREPGLSKTASVRVRAVPIPGLGISASGLVGPGEGETTRVLWSGLVDGQMRNTHLLGEAYGGQGLGQRELGAQAALGQDVWIERADAIDRLNFVGRAMWFDPDLDTDLDHRLTLVGGANVFFAAESAGPIKPVIMAGVSYQVLVPQDVDLPIEHEAVAELRVMF